uniref:Transposase n=1 Tax=Ascaris lumbricoides TaxID=6252 RepID=A0A0M3HTA0_ASCLU
MKSDVSGVSALYVETYETRWPQRYKASLYLLRGRRLKICRHLSSGVSKANMTPSIRALPGVIPSFALTVSDRQSFTRAA